MDSHVPFPNPPSSLPPSYSQHTTDHLSLDFPLQDFSATFPSDFNFSLGTMGAYDTTEMDNVQLEMGSLPTPQTNHASDVQSPDTTMVWEDAFERIMEPIVDPPTLPKHTPTPATIPNADETLPPTRLSTPLPRLSHTALAELSALFQTGPNTRPPPPDSPAPSMTFSQTPHPSPAWNSRGAATSTPPPSPKGRHTVRIRNNDGAEDEALWGPRLEEFNQHDPRLERGEADASMEKGITRCGLTSRTNGTN